MLHAISSISDHLASRDLQDRIAQLGLMLMSTAHAELETVQSRAYDSALSRCRAVLAALKPDAAVPLDHLVETLAGHSPSEIIAGLFELEMAGMVRQLPGKSFLKVWLE